ncbi:MAG TPA: trypsin-like peptidase domain-containing protein [Planctomycetota bacterium]|nr:trypsin-like peptidase domain-containing protein [Planctomycetota bacterium]
MRVVFHVALLELVMAAPAKPTQWVYWRCPRCGTSLVGNQEQLGQKFVCVACKAETTVGGVAMRPKTVVNPPPGTDAVFAALKSAPVERPKTSTSAAMAALGIRDDAEAAARKAAALAQAEALRPVHEPTLTTGHPPPSARQEKPPAGAGRGRGSRARRGSGGTGGNSNVWVSAGVIVAAGCLLAAAAIGLYFAVFRPTAGPGGTPSSVATAQNNSAGAAATAPAQAARLPAPALTEVTRPNANPPVTPKVEPPATPPTATGVLTPEDVYAVAEKSVVVISRFEPGHNKPTAFGSGFFLDGADVIVTNAHVIENADMLEIKTRDGFAGRLDRYITFDRRRDIALLPIPEGLEHRKGLKLAAGLPRIGEKVFALGCPQGLDWTFTSGLVSQIRTQVRDYNTLIQTDASLSPGSSGGPLLNTRAEVIGVTTLASRAIADANNLNFAVAASEIRDANEHRGEGQELPGRHAAQP